jgi:hypothetical protein
VALRDANRIIEGRVSRAWRAGPRGAGLLRGSRAFRNALLARQRGWALSLPHTVSYFLRKK